MSTPLDKSKIAIFPANQPMKTEDVLELIGMGFQCISNIALINQKAIVVPGQDAAPVVVCNIWYQPMPAIPIKAIIQCFLAAEQEGGSPETLAWLSASLLGVEWEQLKGNIFGPQGIDTQEDGTVLQVPGEKTYGEDNDPSRSTS